MNRLNQVRGRTIAVLLPWAMGLGVVLIAAEWNSSLAAPSPAAGSEPQYRWLLEQDGENMGVATAMFQQRGANVSETRVSGTKAILSNVTDPHGVRMELLEIPPESLHRQAMERWK